MFAATGRTKTNCLHIPQSYRLCCRHGRESRGKYLVGRTLAETFYQKEEI